MIKVQITLHQQLPALTVKGLSAMYLQNKYTTCYYSIINKAMSRELPTNFYTEKHHIIPKSLGGLNASTNIVKLTAREHFICHLLLPRMLTGLKKRSMTFALWSMINRDHSGRQLRYKINSRMHASIRQQVANAASELHKGKVVTAETKAKISAKAKGKTVVVTNETREKISNTLKGRVPTWLVGKPAHNRGIAHSTETIAKLSIPKPKIICPHCGATVGGHANYNRWHGNNCKHVK